MACKLENVSVRALIRRGCVVFNATFKNISVMSRQLVLLMEESGVLLGENHRSVSSHRQALSQCCIEYTSP